jgi:hypothetical protein
MPKSWLHFQDHQSQLFFEKTFILIKPTIVTPMFYLSIVDPEGTWFHKWIRDLRTRRFVEQYIEKNYTKLLLAIVREQATTTIRYVALTLLTFRYLIQLHCVAIVAPLLCYEDAKICFDNVSTVELELVQLMIKTNHSRLREKIQDCISDRKSHCLGVWKEISRSLVNTTFRY